MVRILEINAQNPWWSQGVQFTHYDKSGKEKKIDVLFQEDGGYSAVEVKYRGQVA